MTVGMGPTTSTSVLRVATVDDHRAFCEAVGLAISLEDDLDWVGQAHTAAEAIDLVSRVQPDVLLLDQMLPDGDGTDTVAALADVSPHTRVLIVTGHADLSVMARAADAGCSGLLAKESAISEILTSIRTASEHSLRLDSRTLASSYERMMRRLTPQGATDDPSRPALTRREMDVLVLLDRGLDPASIARQLCVSVHTCRGYLKTMFAKLDAHSQIEAVAIARRRGLLGRSDR